MKRKPSSAKKHKEFRRQRPARGVVSVLGRLAHTSNKRMAQQKKYNIGVDPAGKEDSEVTIIKREVPSETQAE